MDSRTFSAHQPNHVETRSQAPKNDAAAFDPKNRGNSSPRPSETYQENHTGVGETNRTLPSFSPVSEKAPSILETTISLSTVSAVALGKFEIGIPAQVQRNCECHTASERNRNGELGRPKKKAIIIWLSLRLNLSFSNLRKINSPMIRQIAGT